MKKYVVMSLLVFAILLIPSVAYAGHEGSTWTWNEGYGPEEIKECQFTASIEKSWVFFTERPWVTGFVNDCEVYHYFEKDRVFVRILDINGDLVEDTWQPYSVKTDPLVAPSLYEFTYDVYRDGARGGTNVEKDTLVYIAPNQYFFYMPQINALDFDHRGIYQIELTYGDHVRTIWFASLSLDIPWQLDKVPSEDLCIDFEEKLLRLENKLASLDTQLDRYKQLGQDEKTQGTVDLMNETNMEIKSLKECQGE